VVFRNWGKSIYGRGYQRGQPVRLSSPDRTRFGWLFIRPVEVVPVEIFTAAV
jgi:hypothetical protein